MCLRFSACSFVYDVYVVSIRVLARLYMMYMLSDFECSLVCIWCICCLCLRACSFVYALYMLSHFKCSLLDNLRTVYVVRIDRFVHMRTMHIYNCANKYMNVHIFAYSTMNTCSCVTSILIYVYLRIHVYTSMWGLVYTYMHLRAPNLNMSMWCDCVHIHIHIYVCMYVCMYIYIHIYVCMYIYVYIYIYIYIYIYPSLQSSNVHMYTFKFWIYILFQCMREREHSK